MSIADDRAVTIPSLRQALGLPAERPDGVRDLLVVPRQPGTPVPARRPGAWQLALGDWPEQWRAAPETGPQFLVMLHGLSAPYFIATVDEVHQGRWGEDSDNPPNRRQVPVVGTARGTALLAGCRLDCDLTFGWQLEEEQFAFV
ncbi:MAG: hypothetical protein JO345_33100 [Streptosporangiaceae bacterium]|nr:hypothetical protein [Streptosporangiaceae bacterium]